jgi:hypothetical protein
MRLVADEPDQQETDLVLVVVKRALMPPPSSQGWIMRLCVGGSDGGGVENGVAGAEGGAVEAGDTAGDEAAATPAVWGRAPARAWCSRRRRALPMPSRRTKPPTTHRR